MKGSLVSTEPLSGARGPLLLQRESPLGYVLLLPGAEENEIKLERVRVLVTACGLRLA